MQLSNFHTHTALCHHAEGMPSDYVEQAVRESCVTMLGFSDHCPYPEEFMDMWPNIRMTIDETRIYLDEIERSKETASFPIYTGYECEWDGEFSIWYDELRSTYGAQYLVLGSHWVTDGSNHVYAPDIDSPLLLNKYIDQTIDGMRSGKFAFVAHPDLFMCGCREWNEQTKACSQAIIDAAQDLNLPLEINGLGMSRATINTKNGMRYQYPYTEFWEMVARSSVPVVCNSDAHKPQDVVFNALKARDFAARFGLKPEN